MLKATTSIIENDKYEVQAINAHYLKRIEKSNKAERYFCIAQSEKLTLSALSTYVKSAKSVMAQLGEANTRATLTDAGNDIYQATFVYFEDSLDTLKTATENLSLLDSKEAKNHILTNE
ncbi:hypothetical protein OXR01_08815 [Staphylococcus gallinarum]|jgi:hypothetical protein|uniref:hypothetical protein n=1 Tax=Staphylococcus gallinarum TaxID=1293 RepID=UPI000D1C355F|nr:hypothetical protein [Staphylococcus gallinarum]MBU7216709.1 hypothetical protein [Staphylococcus gallinarum]MCD8828953.1 hypothetical protein [Staphylococcus gallinarum]MCD8844100.1 hypothetical protein [Staphylococcus gallinarum]MCD8871616.1 hypothetical protein [Staphylococcus gallinarum]MCD8902886.1 hypothetical protein [Staphylococcus gallinarum]